MEKFTTILLHLRLSVCQVHAFSTHVRPLSKLPRPVLWRGQRSAEKLHVGQLLSNERRENFGHYAGSPSLDGLARRVHLDDSDHRLIAKKRGSHNPQGFSGQLGTARYLGTFVEGPLAVPAPVLQVLARYLFVVCIPVYSR